MNCVSSGIKSLKDRIGLKQPDNCKSNLKGSEKRNEIEEINFMYLDD
jgi:hypothetical protein